MFRLDDYLKLLSRLGPLVSPSAIYPADCAVIDLPGILTGSDDAGLGLSIATTPLSVVNQWLIPHKSDFKCRSVEDADWFIAAAQLIILSGQLDDKLISQLPIVCQARDSVKLFNPSTDVAFLPPVVMQTSSDVEEHSLLALCTKVEEVLLASSAYFESCGASLALKSLEMYSKWRSLFSIAGKH